MIERTIDLILDSACRIFADHCDKSLLDLCEGEDNVPGDLWDLLKKNGFNLLGSEESGTSLSDLYEFLIECGRHAVPLPISETLLMNIWFGNSEEMSGVGELFGNQIFNVPFGMSVGRIGVVEKGKDYVTMLSNRELIDSAFNVAGERRDVLTFSEGEKISIGSDPYAQMALTRVCLLVGCMQTVLDLGVQFASERTQFGRSISKFQAIQHLSLIHI